MAADLLDELDIDYREVFLDDHPDRSSFTANLKPGHFTVPLVMVGERALGGMDDLRSLHARGELLPALRPDG
jgi:glutaredoxin 3